MHTTHLSLHQVNIHSDGRYGFIELRTAEYATAALELTGQINLMNQALSIGRPASYVDPNKVGVQEGSGALMFLLELCRMCLQSYSQQEG